MPMAACGADPIERESHCHCIFRTEEYYSMDSTTYLYLRQKVGIPTVGIPEFQC